MIPLTMSKFEKHIDLAKSLKMVNAKLISPEDIHFDVRAILKYGIDVYKTARSLGLPCQVLQNKEDVQNRYGLVLIE